MKSVIFSAMLVLLVPGNAAEAQAPAIQRTVLQRTDVGNGFEAILGLAEIAPGGSTGRHSHPGIETGYVLEGTALMAIDGQPPRTLRAGESYLVPAGTIHEARTGEGAAKVIATYVVQQGQPLTTPAAP